jgi:peptide/nickel transport system substrate-binding protein
VKRAVFRDKRFRYALSYAINRPDMNQTCFYGLGEPRQMAPPKTSAFAHESYAKAKTEYRPDEAKRLLDAMSHEGLLGPRDKEGFRTLPNGKPLTLEIESVAMASDLDALQLVVDAWCAVGLRSTLKAEARPLFYQRKDGALHDVAVWFGADEMQPMLDPRWFFPFTKESLYGVKYSIWFRAPEANRANLSKKDPDSVPTPEMQRANDLFEKAKLTTDRDAQVRLFRQIMDICAEELWAIGTVGELPAVFLVKDDFRNVPEVAVSGWSFRTPGNTAPECYAIER